MFAQDEGGEGLVGYADVQVNLKDINDNAPIFPQGVYFGNVTENGTAGMVVMTMTAVDYDDPNEGELSFFFLLAFGKRLKTMENRNSAKGVKSANSPDFRDTSLKHSFVILCF